MLELVNMTDEKKSTTEPTFVIASAQNQDAETPKKYQLTRKHVLAAVVSLVITGVIATAVLVGMHMYADSTHEILKYTMKMKDKDNHDVKQDVSTDEDANIVQYHIVKDGVEAWILQDFDKGIEVSKVDGEDGVQCFVAALNRSNAQEPKTIPSTAPNPDDRTPSEQLVYKVSETPIADISYLGKRVVKLCKNIPMYWMEPSCANGDSEDEMTNTTSPAQPGDRQKRATVCATCRGYYCVCGCCWAVCGRFASSRYTWYYSRGRYHCVYRMWYVSCAVNLARTNCYLRGRRYYYPWS